MEKLVRLPKSCIFGIVLNLLESSLSGVCFFLSYYFVNSAHITITTSGMIVSCYAIGTAMGGIMGGKLTDKFSPAKVLSYSLIFEGIAFFALSQAVSSFALMLILLSIGITMYCFITSNTVQVLQQCKNNEDENLKAINMLYVASNLGFGIAACIIMFLSTKGFQTIFAFSSVCLLLIGIYSLIFEKNSNDIQLVEHKTVDTGTVESEKKSVHHPDIRITFLILSCLFLVGLIVAQRSAIYLVYVNSMFPTMGMISLSLLFLLNPLLITLFQTPVVSYFSNYNKITMVGLGAFLMGMGSLMLNFSYNVMLILFSCVLYTFGEMIFFSISQFVCYQNSDQKKKGESFGLFKFIYASSLILGPALSGFIYHYLGNHALWYIDGFFGLVCLMSCGYFKSIKI